MYLQKFLQSLYTNYPHVIPYKFPLKPPCHLIRRNNEFRLVLSLTRRNIGVHIPTLLCGTLFLVPCSHNSAHRRVVWSTIRPVAILSMEIWLSYRHYSCSDKYIAKLCAILHSASDPTVPSRCAEPPFVDSNSSYFTRDFAECVQSGKLVAFCCVPWPYGGARQRSTLCACVTSRTQNKFVTYR
jgi:hypothetical protein